VLLVVDAKEDAAYKKKQQQRLLVMKLQRLVDSKQEPTQAESSFCLARECTAYEALSPLQGTVVPEAVFFGEVSSSTRSKTRYTALVTTYEGCAGTDDRDATSAAWLPYVSTSADAKIAHAAIRSAALRAIDAIHACGVLHNDVRCDNMIVMPTACKNSNSGSSSSSSSATTNYTVVVKFIDFVNASVYATSLEDASLDSMDSDTCMSSSKGDGDGDDDEARRRRVAFSVSAAQERADVEALCSGWLFG
jgi:hypothetical protein